jgi:cation transporter-like permease
MIYFSLAKTPELCGVTPEQLPDVIRRIAPSFWMRLLIYMPGFYISSLVARLAFPGFEWPNLILNIFLMTVLLFLNLYVWNLVLINSCYRANARRFLKSEHPI